MTIVGLELDGLDRLAGLLGEETADRLVRAMADTLRQLARDTDQIARLGRGTLRGHHAGDAGGSGRPLRRAGQPGVRAAARIRCGRGSSGHRLGVDIGRRRPLPGRATRDRVGAWRRVARHRGVQERSKGQGPATAALPEGAVPHDVPKVRPLDGGSYVRADPDTRRGQVPSPQLRPQARSSARPQPVIRQPGVPSPGCGRSCKTRDCRNDRIPGCSHGIPDHLRLYGALLGPSVPLSRDRIAPLEVTSRSAMRLRASPCRLSRSCLYQPGPDPPRWEVTPLPMRLRASPAGSAPVVSANVTFPGVVGCVPVERRPTEPRRCHRTCILLRAQPVERVDEPCQPPCADDLETALETREPALVDPCSIRQGPL